MATLTIQGLTHCYKKYVALQNVDATLNHGIVALIGPNGAGKTTLINDIVGLLYPTQGTVLFNGQDIGKLGKQYYRSLGYCPQAPLFYPNFTPVQFLMYMGTMKGIGKEKLRGRVEDLLHGVNLWEKRDVKIAAFSGGMKQRLGIAQAMLNDPELLVLDEPTAGLDPNERIRLRNLLSQISSQRIIILATHIISDVESIANQVLLLKQGHLIMNDSPERVLSSLAGRTWLLRGISKPELLAYTQDYILSNVRQNPDETYDVKIVSDQCPHAEAQHGTPTLEDVFLYYFHEHKEGEKP